MQGEIHEGPGLKYLTVLPDGYDPEAAYPVVIMLHGFGANMHDLAGLAPPINSTGYVYACPNAPIPFNLGQGHAGFGWMTPRGGSTPDEMANSEKLLDDFFQEVLEKFRVGPGKALLLGFSQGGGMTYRCGLGRAETFAGLAALSATLPGADELDPRLPADRSQPIFVAHGRYDQMIAESTAYAAKDYLETAGYSPELHVYDMGHEISGELLGDLVPWIASVLPPRAAE